jgi:hypothetical protein
LSSLALLLVAPDCAKQSRDLPLASYSAAVVPHDVLADQRILWCIGTHFMKCSYSKIVRIINAQSADRAGGHFLWWEIEMCDYLLNQNLQYDGD